MFISASCGLLASASSNAHELWIAPQSAPIETGDVLDIDIFVGENFEGNAQIYLPRRTELLAIASTEGVSDIQPRIGSASHQLCCRSRWACDADVSVSR